MPEATDRKPRTPSDMSLASAAYAKITKLRDSRAFHEKELLRIAEKEKELGELPPEAAKLLAKLLAP